MRTFIHRENIKHYARLLEETTIEAERDRILKLLAEEIVKDMDHLDNLEPRRHRDGALRD